MDQDQSVIPTSYRDILAANAIAHVGTIGPHGEPQSSPVWFDWDGRNLRRNPKVALSITDPANPCRYLEIRGEVMRVDEDRGSAFITALTKKYAGQDRYPNL